MHFANINLKQTFLIIETFWIKNKWVLFAIINTLKKTYRNADDFDFRAYEMVYYLYYIYYSLGLKFRIMHL